MKRLLLPLSILVAMGLPSTSVKPSSAVDLSCPYRSPEEFVEGASLIAVGRIQGVIQHPERRRDYGLPYSETAAVSVERYIKGSGLSEIVVDTDSALFGKDSLGGAYIFFLVEPSLIFQGTPGAYYTSRCLGSLPLDDYLYGYAARERLRVAESLLGPGSLPETGGAPAQDSSFPALAASLAAVLGPVAFLAGAAFVWRRGEPHNG